MFTQIASVLLGFPPSFRVHADKVEEATITLFVTLKRRRARCPLRYRLRAAYRRAPPPVVCSSCRKNAKRRTSSGGTRL